MTVDKMKNDKRTRDGCWTCRRRKKKCDARHPLCYNCEVLGLQCEGYANKILWPDSDIRTGMSRRGPSKNPNRGSSPVRQRSKPPESDMVSDAGHRAFSAPSFDNPRYHRPSPTASHLSCIEAANINSKEELRFNRSTSRPVEAWTMTRSLSPHPLKLTSTQSILFDHYINGFSKIYPTCVDLSNPFLSVYATLALRNETTLCALLALSGTRLGREGGFEMKQEILRLKGYALKGCQRLITGIDCESDSMGSEDTLILIATVMLLILFDKLSGETHERLRPHLEFLGQIFTDKFQRTGSFKGNLESSDFQLPGKWPNEYRFLHSEFLYNDLLVAMSSGRPTISNYSALFPGDQASPQIPRKVPNSSSRFFFPVLISQIINYDGEVCLEDFDNWDGQLDWMPSFCYKDECNTIPSSNGSYISAATLESDTGTRSATEESWIMSEIYRNAGRIFYLQRRRISWELEMSKTSGTECLDSEAKMKALVALIIELLASLPQLSNYESAILWPVGILANEITLERDRSLVLWRMRSLEQRFGMEVFCRFRESLERSWTCDGSASSLLLPAVALEAIGRHPRKSVTSTLLLG